MRMGMSAARHEAAIRRGFFALAHTLGAVSLLALPTTAVVAQPAPAISKVEPPTWWAGHSINPVRLLVRGSALSGAAFDCAPLVCSEARVNESGTYAFVNVTIPTGTAPARYPLTLRTPAGAAPIEFSVIDTLSRAGRFAGFGPDDVFYLLMPDRFANGDTTNDNPSQSPGMHDRSRGRYYHGGDIAGIRQRLSYLRDLGITALWLNPLYDNVDHLNERETYDNKPITDYHGYGAVDFYGVEEHLGTLDEVRLMVREAQALGIKVVFDMVANHTGPYHPWVTQPPTPTWYNGSQADHLSNTWQTWTLADPYATPATQRATLEGWFGGFLPDLNQNDPDVARYIIQNTLWWVGVTGIDGIRQDTWPYVPRAFWRDWMTAIKREHPTLRVVGEVYDGDPALVAFFQGGRAQDDGIDTRVDALYDFPLFYPARRAFAEGGALREVVMALARDHLYPDPDNLITFVGLHDVARFMSERGATAQGLRLAFTFLLTGRGIPLVYYGDEIAMAGGNDPDNRRDFPGGWAGDTNDAFVASGRTTEQQAMWSHVQQLTRLRADRADLRRAPIENLHVNEQQWVFRRGRTVVAMNNDTSTVAIVLQESQWPTGSRSSDALGNCAAPARSAGQIVVTVPPRTGCVF